MRFGIREICDVVLRAKATQTLGSRKFYKNEPVLYFDTLKTSSLEGAATTVYAQGGRGNTRLVAWEGERTLTFTMEDALLSMESFSILSGAGLMDASKEKPIYVHQTSTVEVKDANTIIVPDLACWNGFKDKDNELYHGSADIFVMVLNNGEVNAEPCIPVEVVHDIAANETTLTCYSHVGILPKGTIVLVDYYVKRIGGAQEITIDAEKFGGNYYLEASTLFRRESDGVDMPAEFIIPNCKVQSNFTFSLAATGDPSTFTFTMDAFPDYTKFDQTHKVLAAIQVITDESGETEAKREPCAENVTTFEPAEGSDAVADIKVEFVENSATAATLNVTGTASGKAYDQENYGTAIPQGVQIKLQVPVEADSTVYKAVSTNPIYTYYPDDSRVENGVKTQEVTGEDLANNFLVVLGNESQDTDVVIEITKVNGDFHKTYTIQNNVEFAAGASISGASTYSTRITTTVDPDND